MIEEALRRPDPSERRVLLSVLARAFDENPMNLAIHGSDPKRRVRANRAGMASIVLDSQEQVEARVIYNENRVAGGLLVTPPATRVFPRPSFLRQIGCLFHQGARAMDQWGRLSAALAPLRPVFPHWYLAVLGVDPEVQSRGLGSQLIAGLFDLVEADSAPVYLECDRESSVDFYLARGFGIREETEVHGVRVWCLGWGFADEDGDLCDPVRQAHS